MARRWLAVLPRRDAALAGNLPSGLDLYAPMTPQLTKQARDA